MPRQIIDTESSRPAYQRRLAVRWIVTVVLIVIVAFVAFELWKGTHRPLSNLGLLSSPALRLERAPTWGS